MNIKKIKRWFRNKIKIQPDNRLEIHSSTRIRGCEIFIKGKNNSLFIGENCNLRNMKIEILGEDCTIHIGAGTVNTGS